MAAALSVCQELLTFSVCLEILKEPVSLPCGHSFCRTCITTCWDRKGEPSCPDCRKTFNPRPDLSKNILLSELVQFLMKTGLGAALCQRYVGPVGVLCDICIGKKLTAVKLCMTCHLSSCESHVWLHYKITDWKNHKMSNPPGSLQEKVCTKQQKALESSCRNDTSHRSPETVELGTVRAKKRRVFADKKLREWDKAIDVISHSLVENKTFIDKTKEQENKAEVELEQLKKEFGAGESKN